jgi:hypothetical protein
MLASRQINPTHPNKTGQDGSQASSRGRVGKARAPTIFAKFTSVLRQSVWRRGHAMKLLCPPYKTLAFHSSIGYISAINKWLVSNANLASVT